MWRLALAVLTLVVVFGGFFYWQRGVPSGADSWQDLPTFNPSSVGFSQGLSTTTSQASSSSDREPR